jgi:thioredoxin reductase (NADPH)
MYDSIIIGGGVAGLTASIYLSRYKLSHLIFDELPGGQGLTAHIVENYPGFNSIPGPELMQKFIDHTKSYGVEIIQKKIVEITGLAGNGGFNVKADKGEEYEAKTLILAMGALHRVLNIPGEEKFLGRGVSYCATCDAPLYKGKTVAIVGGGDSAITGALHLAEFCPKVYLIHRRNEFRAEPVWVEKLNQRKSIEKILNNTISEIIGTKEVEKAILSESYGGKKKLAVQGVFIEIGQIPAATLVTPLGVKLTEQGYIEIKPDMSTNISGIFAAGDLAFLSGSIPVRQFITSASDGARAAVAIFRYLNKNTPVPSWG